MFFSTMMWYGSWLKISNFLNAPQPWASFYYQRLTWIPAWISNHMPIQTWDGIINPILNFYGVTVQCWEWICNFTPLFIMHVTTYCPACRTTLIATRFWVVMICPIIKCLTVLEFSFILFDLCLFITIFNFILNYVPIVTFWIFTYHKILILLIIFCFIWSYWIIYFLTCLEVFWSVVS